MDILWDAEKNEWLKHNRGISFEEIADSILEKQYHEIIANPARPEQMCFIMTFKKYTWAVPFVLDEERRIILKTAFMSIKFHKRYRNKGESDAQS